MNRQQKINLLKQVQSGIYDDRLATLIKERTGNSFESKFNKYFFHCFFCIVEFGRIIGNNNPAYSSQYVICETDEEPLIKELAQLGIDHDYGKLSDRYLNVIVEIGQSIKILDERNELHLLEKYTELANEADKKVGSLFKTL